jgi:hypothetical protein
MASVECALDLYQLPSVALLDVFVKNYLKLFDDPVAFQRDEQLAINIYGGFWLFEGSWQGDTYIRVLRFAGAVDDTSHYGELELFDACVLLLPLRHLLDKIALNPLGELLEVG